MNTAMNSTLCMSRVEAEFKRDGIDLGKIDHLSREDAEKYGSPRRESRMAVRDLKNKCIDEGIKLIANVVYSKGKPVAMFRVNDHLGVLELTDSHRNVKWSVDLDYVDKSSQILVKYMQKHHRDVFNPDSYKNDDSYKNKMNLNGVKDIDLSNKSCILGIAFKPAFFNNPDKIKALTEQLSIIAKEVGVPSDNLDLQLYQDVTKQKRLNRNGSVDAALFESKKYSMVGSVYLKDNHITNRPDFMVEMESNDDVEDLHEKAIINSLAYKRDALVRSKKINNPQTELNKKSSAYSQELI